MTIAAPPRPRPLTRPRLVPRRMGTRERLARAWYELQPATVDGREIPFDEAPPARLAWVYARAAQALAVLQTAP